jgi:hypothetical protein
MKTTHDNLGVLLGCMFAGLAGTGLLVGAGEVQAVPMTAYFDVISGESTEGPPYPTSEPTMVKVQDKASPLLAALPLEEVSFNYSITPPELPTMMTASDSGGGPGTGGTVATFAVYLKEGGPPPPQTMAHQMWIDILSIGGGATIVPGPSTFSDSFFDVYFDASFPDGKVITHHLHGMVGQLGETLPLEEVSFSSVALDDIPTEAYDCALGLEMSMGGAVVDLSQPLMTVELTGTWVPEPGSLVLLGLGVLALGLLVRSRKR